MVVISQVLNQSAVDYLNGPVSASQVGFYLRNFFEVLVKELSECNIRAIFFFIYSSVCIGFVATGTT